MSPDLELQTTKFLPLWGKKKKRNLLCTLDGSKYIWGRDRLRVEFENQKQSPGAASADSTATTSGDMYCSCLRHCSHARTSNNAVPKARYSWPPCFSENGSMEVTAFSCCSFVRMFPVRRAWVTYPWPCCKEGGEDKFLDSVLRIRTHSYIEGNCSNLGRILKGSWHFLSIIMSTK